MRNKKKLKETKTSQKTYYIIISLFLLIIIFLILNVLSLIKIITLKEARINVEKSPEFIKLKGEIIDKSFKLNSSDIVLGPNVVYLKIDKCKVLDMVTTNEQIARIEKAKNKARLFRPEKEDLISDVLDIYNIELEFVFIEKIVEGTYFSKIILKQNNKIAVLDSKPTDALILASIFDADIYINKELESLFKEVC